MAHSVARAVPDREKDSPLSARDVNARQVDARTITNVAQLGSRDDSGSTTMPRVTRSYHVRAPFQYQLYKLLELPWAAHGRDDMAPEQWSGQR